MQQVGEIDGDNVADVNPVPYGDELYFLVDEDDNRISIELEISICSRFGILHEKARF